MSPTRCPQVLVAEDDAATRDLIRIVLERGGFCTRVVPDGIAALEACLEQPPDLAIFDVRMPGLSAFDVLERLEAEGRLGSFPVIVTTAMASAELKASKFDGVCVTISKPFDIAEFLDAVKRCLTRAA